MLPRFTLTRNARGKDRYMADHSRLIGYARTSTKEQDLDEQITALRHFGVAPEDIFSDEITALTHRRERFKDCMKHLQPGDTLVIHKLDRLGRSVLGIFEIVDDLKRRGVALTVISEPQDTTRAIVNSFMQFSSVAVELERSLSAERARSNLERKRERGEPLGRRPVISEEVWNFAVEQRRKGVSFPVIYSLAKDDLGYKGGKNSFYTYKKQIDKGDDYPWTLPSPDANNRHDWAET